MIYIDFERLGTKDAQPAILGVVVPPGGEANYTAYLVDPRLHSAAVADEACRPLDLAGALRLVLAAEGPIVSWSWHDLEIVKKAGLPDGVVHACEARWQNALKDVRRWKAKLYPDWKLPVVAGADGHALKRYTAAIGYQIPKALGPGNAAKWLRHVLASLEANGGRYRSLSTRTKRHWHYLLDYNRHDCIGMQAVHQRACRELALEKAYRATTYTVEIDGVSFPIRVGYRHSKLDARLGTGRAARWACITAWNPQSEPLTADENRGRDADLKRALAERALRWHSMVSAGDDGRWPPEPGVLVLGISRSRAEQIGQQFDQAAVVWGQAGGNAELVWCNQLSGAKRKARPR